MERSEQNKHLVCNEDKDFDNGDDDSVDNGVADGVDDGAEDADKHRVHLSHAADCCMMERSEQNKQHVYDEDNDFDNGGDDSVDNGVADGVDDGAEGADKHLTYLSQAAD
eukprot:574199-Ditylum_brightwellii.AAC.1